MCAWVSVCLQMRCLGRNCPCLKKRHLSGIEVYIIKNLQIETAGFSHFFSKFFLVGICDGMVLKKFVSYEKIVVSQNTTRDEGC